MVVDVSRRNMQTLNDSMVITPMDTAIPMPAFMPEGSVEPSEVPELIGVGLEDEGGLDDGSAPMMFVNSFWPAETFFAFGYLSLGVE